MRHPVTCLTVARHILSRGVPESDAATRIQTDNWHRIRHLIQAMPRQCLLTLFVAKIGATPDVCQTSSRSSSFALIEASKSRIHLVLIGKEFMQVWFVVPRCLEEGNFRFGQFPLACHLGLSRAAWRATSIAICYAFSAYLFYCHAHKFTNDPGITFGQLFRKSFALHTQSL